MIMYDFVEDCEYWGYDGVQLYNKTDRIFDCFFSKKEDKEAIQAQIAGFIY